MEMPELPMYLVLILIYKSSTPWVRKMSEKSKQHMLNILGVMEDEVISYWNYQAELTIILWQA